MPAGDKDFLGLPSGEVVMLRVAIAGSFAASLEQPLRRRLAIPCDIVVADEVAIIPSLGEADVLISMALTAEMSRDARRLKLVQVPGAGLDRIDRAAVPAGAVLANVYGHETGIAEYVIGATLTLTREFTRLDAALRRGEWQSQWAVGRPIPPVWPELAGKTLGLLGFGRIGRAVARRVRAFDMSVVAIRGNRVTPRDDPAVIGGLESMDELLQRADYVVVAMPATAETRGAIGRRELALMKPTAYLINVARAEIVDEAALYDALAQRLIAGAALDVWYRYPREPVPTAPATWPFHELPNVLMTPHVAGWTDGMLDARATLIAENIARIARGEAPLNRVA
jgi:phosphoglycerate dehydrogenase-like enzyme